MIDMTVQQALEYADWSARYVIDEGVAEDQAEAALRVLAAEVRRLSGQQ